MESTPIYTIYGLRHKGSIEVILPRYLLYDSPRYHKLVCHPQSILIPEVYLMLGCGHLVVENLHLYPYFLQNPEGFLPCTGCCIKGFSIRIVDIYTPF